MQGVSNTLERDTPFPDTTTREKVRINVCRPTYDFWARSSNVLTSGIRCLSVRTLKTSVYSASTENVQPLYQHIFVPVEPFTTAPGTLDIVRHSMIRRVHAALIRMEGVVFSIYCEL